MSTRAVIARPSGDGFEGRYHHFDGYPAGLGRTLWRLARHEEGPFDNLPAMMHTLLDAHYHWSTINNADWSKSAGYYGLDLDSTAPRPPACYCHGERSESDPGFIKSDGDDWSTEWAYVIDADSGTFTVFERTTSDGDHPFQAPFLSHEGLVWKPLLVTNVNDVEPDWCYIQNWCNDEAHPHHDALNKVREGVS